MAVPKGIQDLIDAFSRLPGIGPKTAARLAYHLLHAPEEETQKLAEAALSLKQKTKICRLCKNLTEEETCAICQSPERDQSIICVVEDPLDVWAIEKAHCFAGLYHVLHGRIAPLDNIGPDELFIADLLPRLKNGKISEVILATNPDMEGEATALYIQRLVKPLGIRITRIARGLPQGADLEYADEITLKKAIEGRGEY